MFVLLFVIFEGTSKLLLVPIQNARDNFDSLFYFIFNYFICNYRMMRHFGQLGLILILRKILYAVQLRLK